MIYVPENPGDDVILFSEELGLSEGTGGSAGDPVILYGPGLARGLSSPAQGDDALLISEEVAQTGPGGFISVEGTEITLFETERTHKEFGNNDNLYFDDPDGDSDSPGLEANSVDDIDEYAAYIFGHYSKETGTYALGAWYWDRTLPDSEDGGCKTTWVGLPALNPTDPPHQDDRLDEGVGGGAQDDKYNTDGNGNPLAQHQFGVSAGDSVMYEFESGQSFTVDLTFENIDDGREPTTEGLPNRLRITGPEGSFEEDIFDGKTITFEVQV